MAVVGGHLAVVAAGAGGADDGGERADILGREEPVGGDAHQREVRGDARVGGVGHLVRADGIEDVHGAGDGDVGVGVEAGDEALALVVEVAGDVEATASPNSPLIDLAALPSPRHAHPAIASTPPQSPSPAPPSGSVVG